MFLTSLTIEKISQTKFLCRFPAAVKCPDNSAYEICATACDTPCPGLVDVIKCNIQTCVEGCRCKPGFFSNGTGCVKEDQCSCYQNGKTFKVSYC